ncbi:MAG: TIGR03032 family protein, partial [Bacteroidota bacterium]
MQKPFPPFACTTSPNVPELLMQMGITLAISTYQAGKVVFISAQNAEKIIQLPRTFKKAMGIAFEGRRMAIATQEEVVVLANSPQLAGHYPNKPDTYDALFMPRATYYTGQIDIHDLDYGTDGLYAVNTSFSCLIKIDDTYSFLPVWKPGFISKMASEDRCHLNGMAMEAGQPRYATAFAATDTPQGWRPVVTTDGLIFDVPSGELLATGVSMPHSPRIFDQKLFVLLSATGELMEVDRQNGKLTPVTKLKGFVRGMARHGDYLFIGLSRLRKNSSTFAQLKIADEAQHAGIA